MRKEKITRREFIEKTTLTVSAAAVLPPMLSDVASAGAAAPAKLPLRVLGRTKVKVPILAFGCGSRFLMYKDEQEALQILNHVIDLGVTYLDTAINYGKGLSETRVGQVMKTRRREVWLATKVPESARTRDGALREVEQSLKRLQTDHVDLLHIHSLGGADDLAKIEAPEGALKALYELREQKVARFIGITSHTDGAVMARAIERHDIDCVQMAMNPARANNFEALALPAARKKNLGVILMKVTAQEKLLGAGAGKADVDMLIRYALSLPVATAVIGMPKPEFIEHNVTVARNFKPLKADEMNTLRNQTASSQASLERFFLDHRDDAHDAHLA
ncbi:MAG: aldo/keto reductase [Pyrinomonadaceae bacterium]|nr:aldo/keto reductase [Pyrinomonadaceae bacterium]